MIDDQLFNRVISTLKENSDCVVVGVADSKENEFRVFYSGDDDMIVRVIEGISEVYINELVEDVKDNTKNISKESIDNAMNEIDWEQFFRDLGDQNNGQN